MTFLFPGFLWAAGAVSLGIIALHLIVTHYPPSDVFPTVRFLPDVQARATSVVFKPNDLLLMLLRIAAVMLIGAALAQPKLLPKHESVARITAVDVSGAASRSPDIADSARRYTETSSVVITFDTVAREASASQVDSALKSAGSSNNSRAGSVSSAMIVMLRAASRIREQADSIELVVVSPFAVQEMDGATASIRSIWPGRITAVRTTLTPDPAQSQAAPMAARIVWADSVRQPPAGWMKRQPADKMSAVRIGDIALVLPFTRSLKADSIAKDAHVYARWADGEPAVIERMEGNSCTRSVGFSIPNNGDIMLRPSVIRFLNALSEPCVTRNELTPLNPEALQSLAGKGTLAPASKVTPQEVRMTPIVPWLLGIAIALLLIEMLVRRAQKINEAENQESPAQREAA